MAAAKAALRQAAHQHRQRQSRRAAPANSAKRNRCAPWPSDARARAGPGAVARLGVTGTNARHSRPAAAPPQTAAHRRAFGMHEQIGRPAVDELDALVDVVRVGRLIPSRPADALLEHHDAVHAKPVLGRKHPIEQLRAELIEAVAHEIVGHGVGKEMPADVEHLHAILDRHRKVEDMLQRAAVDHGGEFPFKCHRRSARSCRGPASALVGRGVDGNRLFRAQALRNSSA